MNLSGGKQWLCARSKGSLELYKINGGSRFTNAGDSGTEVKVDLEGSRQPLPGGGKFVL